jgi:hypothetical protein
MDSDRKKERENLGLGAWELTGGGKRARWTMVRTLWMDAVAWVETELTAMLCSFGLGEKEQLDVDDDAMASASGAGMTGWSRKERRTAWA